MATKTVTWAREAPAVGTALPVPEGVPVYLDYSRDEKTGAKLRVPLAVELDAAEADRLLALKAPDGKPYYRLVRPEKAPDA